MTGVTPEHLNYTLVEHQPKKLWNLQEKARQYVDTEELIASADDNEGFFLSFKFTNKITILLHILFIQKYICAVCISPLNLICNIYKQ